MIDDAEPGKTMHLNDPDRLLPADPALRRIARGLYDRVADLPIISPHGHTDPRWFAENKRFPNPAELFVTPDHYVFRMLVSQGLELTDLGVPRIDGGDTEKDPRRVWSHFAANFHLFRGTPSALWLNYSFEFLFGLTVPLSVGTADMYYDHIDAMLDTPGFRPRALYETFGIEFLATTESALDDLGWHQAITDSGWKGRVVTTYRPDTVVDPEFEGFHQNVATLGDITGEDTATWDGYLAAHRKRRAFFKNVGGATASDHGHPSARTEDLPRSEAAALFSRVLEGDASPDEAETFRGQMLTEMARMSLDDGLTLQIHAGCRRNHHAPTFARHGRDMGFDVPGRTDWVAALQPLLGAVGMERDLRIVLFTLDETAYARELAPLAGVYPALRLGPPWWFYDSVEGIRRYRELTTETAGFYNTAGFNDDTRAFCSIPARHDVARRSDCAYLATLVGTGRLREDEAHEVAEALTCTLARDAYGLA